MRNRPITPHGGRPASQQPGISHGRPLAPSAGGRSHPPTASAHGTGAGAWPAAKHGSAAGAGGGTPGGRGPKRLHVTASGHGLVTASLWRNYKGVWNDTVAFIGGKRHPASPVPEPWCPTAPRLNLPLPPEAPDLPHGRPDPWALATSFEAAALPHQCDLLVSLRFELPQGGSEAAWVDAAGP